MIRYLSIILFALLTFSVNAQNVGKKIYNCYITKDMATWKAVIDSLQKEYDAGRMQEADIWQMLDYQYGYLGWAVSEKKTQGKSAAKYLEVAEENLVDVIDRGGVNATTNAFNAAFVAYDISLNPIKAPFIGLKCMKYAETAVKQDSLNHFALIQYGNIMNYMPTAFGGSKDKALVNYLAAKQIMSKDEALYKNNWLYMNLILTIADIYKGKKDYESTKQYYLEALELQPNYQYVVELVNKLGN